MRYTIALLSALISSTATSLLSACPRCAAGEQARGTVWQESFFEYLALMSLPFLLVGVVAAGAEALERLATRRANSGAREPKSSQTIRRLHT